VDIIQIFQSFTTQEQAIEYLENVRWKGEPHCPYCGSLKVGRHASGDRAMSRWQCRDCSRAFAVTVGTLFHRTHIPLRSWFLVLALMLNAKKSASAYQIARDLGMRRPTVWSMMHRIRAAMAEDEDQGRLLYGIVEADETYIGGKRRKPNRHDDDNGTGKSAGFTGRGTKKVPVAGAVERGGRVVARPVKDASRNSLERFLKSCVDKAGTLLMTDEWSGYGRMHTMMNHAVIRHREHYVDGPRHTNTIEGFWSLVKRAWYGSHHHYSRKYMPLYIAEACYKYNRRGSERLFDNAVRSFVGAVA
jgi:transposase-like protein